MATVTTLLIIVCCSHVFGEMLGHHLRSSHAAFLHLVQVVVGGQLDHRLAAVAIPDWVDDGGDDGDGG